MNNFRMRHRVLSREERESLSGEALKCLYETMNRGYCSPETIEKTLLQAVILARMNQCCVDEDTVSFLLEKISELEEISFDRRKTDGESVTYRYC